MKKIKLLSAVSALAALSLSSCHTETPSGIDNINPKAELLYVYNDTDTLYNSNDSTAFADFSLSILDGDHYLKFKAEDNGELYNVRLIAEDRFTNERYEIKRQNDPVQGENTIKFNYREFPPVQDLSPQEFYMLIRIDDESENYSETIKLGFNVLRVLQFDLFYEALGKIKEIQGDSIDFREKNNKLAFMQFMSKGCVSCIEEAQAMKAFYADPAFDLNKYSHSLFGNDTFTEAEFLSFKTRDYKLPFDCFWDGDGRIREFFETLAGTNIENDVFAVLPNGKIRKYNYLEGGFEDWVHGIYTEAYPNK